MEGILQSNTSDKYANTREAPNTKLADFNNTM
ncbi:hypothetical protein SAMN05444422_112109 [Halobiforma haloterrestris]|uniref:Uncharacterized protein n=1 Tax=Natronobacterium haloterrestre TaxID=148448 RepID=A0A1I1KR92_NATHA|nr:hypothetical protein SAMN05444422_112109 [Halobiforma haloterrestris]